MCRYALAGPEGVASAELLIGALGGEWVGVLLHCTRGCLCESNRTRNGSAPDPGDSPAAPNAATTRLPSLTFGEVLLGPPDFDSPEGREVFSEVMNVRVPGQEVVPSQEHVGV